MPRRRGTLKLHLAGADRTVSPYAIGGRRLALAALQPKMTDFMDVLAHGQLGNVIISEFIVEPSSPLDGCMLSEAFAEKKSTVLGIQRSDGNFVVGPKGQEVLYAGDLVIVLAAEDAVQSLA